MAKEKRKREEKRRRREEKRKGKERKGKERKGKERKGKKRKTSPAEYFSSSPNQTQKPDEGRTEEWLREGNGGNGGMLEWWT
jgi:hypothetical protein